MDTSKLIKKIQMNSELPLTANPNFFVYNPETSDSIARANKAMNQQELESMAREMGITISHLHKLLGMLVTSNPH
jgi:hypothetical protein